MKTHTLLAVDDRPENLFVLKQLIAEYLPECGLVTADNAERGLTLAAEQSFDGVLIDVQMPGIDGIEMCRRLKADKAKGHLPILLVTAHGSTTELRVRGLEAGADDFISRPIGNVELVAKIRVMLRIKRAEDELRTVNARLEQRQQEQRREAILRTSMDGFWMLDLDGNICEVNDAYCDLVGYDRDELLSMKLADLEAVESPEQIEAHLRKVQEAGYSRFEARHRRKDGSTVAVEVCVNSLPLGGGRVFAFFRDVTERKRAEETLRRSEAELNAIYENAPLVMMLVDRQRRVVKLNALALSMAQRSLEEAIGLRSGEALRCVHASDDSKGCGYGPSCEACGVRRTVLSTFQSGKPFHRQEASIPYDHPDGLVDIHVLVSTTSLSVSEEDLVLVCLEDVTERKQAEKALQDAHDQLELRVKERTSQLSLANQTLRREIVEHKRAESRLDHMQAQLAHVTRVSTVGEMVAGIAHEVNQPLCSIRNFSQASDNVLAAKKQANLDDLREWNTAIGKAASRATEIVKRLRGFVVRAESRRSTLAIDEILREALQLVAFEADRHKTVVRLELSEAAPIVHVDRVEIQQVLVNLLQNAYEAMEKADSKTRQVTLRTEVAGEFVEVSVADKGPGLPSENDLQVFDAFVTTKPDGLGMGLAIATTIVQAHDGKLWATSNRSGGATFHFTLPVAPEKQSDAE